MSTIQRRNSQRLASALEALTSDLDVAVTETDVTTDEDMKKRAEEYVKQDVEGRDYDPVSYLGSGQDDIDAQINDLQGTLNEISQEDEQEDEVPQKDIQEDDQDIQEDQNEQQEDDQDIQEDQNEQQKDDQDVQEDQNEQQEDDQEESFDQQAFQAAISQASIEQGDPGVSQFGSQSTKDSDDVVSLGSGYGIDFKGDEDLQPSIRKVPGRKQKQAKIKKLIARIQNVANHLEKTGRKKLAYRLDVVCNNLEKKYSIK